MRKIFKVAMALPAVLGFAGQAHAQMQTQGVADPVSEWNIRAETIQAPLKIPAPPMPSARAIVIMNVAMFEAANTIDPKFEPFGLNLKRDREASMLAAISSAAHVVLTSIYPAHKADLDKVLAGELAKVNDANAREKGVALGIASARAVLDLRATDGIDATETYRPFTAPGVFVPTVVPFYSTLTKAKPWIMKTGSDVRPAGPPALDSARYTMDYNEIRELGRFDSKRRTKEQTDIGNFWVTAGPATWNPLLRQIVVQKKLGIIESARLFAMANMVANDGYQAIFDAKYAYNFWRPVTAIRNADMTNNPNTPRDASWLPLGETPPHPEYPCAHCVASTGVGAVIQKLVSNELELTATSPTAPGVVRKWTRVEDYKKEVSNARIYAGFHYRFSTEVAEDMAHKIADMAVSTKMRPIRN